MARIFITLFCGVILWLLSASVVFAWDVPAEPVKPILPNLTQYTQPVKPSTKEQQAVQRARQVLKQQLYAWVVRVEKTYPIAVAQRLAKSLQKRGYHAFVVPIDDVRARLFVGPEYDHSKVIRLSVSVKRALFGQAVSVQSFLITPKNKTT